MIQQRLTPGVQHGRNPDLGLESSLAKLPERLAGRREQQLEEGGPVLPDQPVDCVRQGKDQMEIRDRQQRHLLLFQPICGPCPLALRTMPIAATVRHEVLALTGGAMEQLAAQRAGPAGGQRAHALPLLRGQAQDGRGGTGDRFAQHLPQGGAAGHGALSKLRQIQQLQRPTDLAQALLAHVQVVGRRGQARMTEQALQRRDLHARLQQMRGKGMSQGVNIITTCSICLIISLTLLVQRRLAEKAGPV